uniref:T-box domain-containing protein n=1 Tax=Anopheles maculatus TaxID=74869 RepID=A0A182TCH2_9DIPT
MFPSMRLTVDGLDADTNYCVLLEMMPISDCRFKFSGSQWVPAGGAEPQSPQRFCLHPDSPALGTHWASQPIVFNKVKLTNNTLDNNGHVVLTSMHKYQPRIHIIRTSDPSQIPWAAQQAFVFPETEFVAVTAYQVSSPYIGLEFSRRTKTNQNEEFWMLANGMKSTSIWSKT